MRKTPICADTLFKEKVVLYLVYPSPFWGLIKYDRSHGSANLLPTFVRMIYSRNNHFSKGGGGEN